MSQLNEKKLGHRLQKARQAAGLTQQELCQKAGLSYSTLAKIERGAIKTPSVFTIQSIAAALSTSLDDLVGSPAAPPRSRSRSGVRFVYFDLNNCLVRFYQRAFTKIAADADIPVDVVETFFWRYNEQVCRGDMSMEEFNQKLSNVLHLSDFDWRPYYLDATVPTPEIGEFVTWAREHYGLGLLTNSMPGVLQLMIVRGLLPKVSFDVVIDSSEVHLVKPERAIYELAQEKSGCVPEEILFIDDTRANIMAAEKLGWHVMWFDDSRPRESVERLRTALELA